MHSIKYNWRVPFIRFLFLFFPLIFVVRLIKIQIIDHEKYKALAKEQQIKEYIIPSRRGDIFFRDHSPLALSQMEYFLYAEPKSIETVSKEIIDNLASILYLDSTDNDLKVNKEFLFNNFSKDSWYVPIMHKVSIEQKKSIEELNLYGLVFKEEPSRYYPEDTMGSHLLGFVGKDQNGIPAGYFGIEGFYDSDLKGKDGRIIQENDAFGNPIIFGDLTNINSVPGKNIILTVDRSIQYLVETKLEKFVKQYGAKSGSVVIVNPLSGEILALANYPNFNPLKPFNNDTKSEQEENNYGIRNLVLSSTYEPGSVFKALTMSSAIDLKIVTPETTFIDDGPRYYSGHKVDTWDGKHYGEESMYEVLQHSNNVGASWVAEKIGSKNLYVYFSKFGIGKNLGIDLEGEDTGILRSYKEWRDIDLAAASFGQGVSATPLQVVMAFSAIANGGELLRPYVVGQIYENSDNDNKKEIYKGSKQIIERVISNETSVIMIDMLTKAVSGGEAKFFVSKNYIVGGKTGTAQIPTSSGYDSERTNATFVGFLTNSKNFVMLVKFEEPSSSVYAAETAVPAWMDIAETLASYFKIPPDF